MDKPRFIYLISVAQKRLAYAVGASGDGHSAARAGLLLALSRDKPTPMSKIQDILDLRAPALSALVERTLEAKLIERLPDPDDGRAWLLRLTDAGAAQRKIAVRIAAQLNDALCDGFTAAELAVVEKFLTAVQRKFPKEQP